MLAAAVGVGDELALFHATFQQTGPALELGNLTEVTGLLNQADDLASRLAQPHLTWLVSFSRAGLAIMLGELAQAETEADRALTLGTGLGRRLEARHSTRNRSPKSAASRAALARSGSLRRAIQAPQLDPTRSLLRYLVALDDDAAAPALDKAITTYGLIPRRDPAERAALDNLAVAVCGLRRMTWSARCTRRSRPMPRLSGIRPWGTTAVTTISPISPRPWAMTVQAAQHFQAAAEIHERCGAPLLLAESLLDWADAIAPPRAPGPAPRAPSLVRTGAAGRGASLLEHRVTRLSA